MYNREWETVAGAKGAYDKAQRDVASDRMKLVAAKRKAKRLARKEAQPE